MALILLLVGFGWRGYADWQMERTTQESAQAIWRKFEFPVSQSGWGYLYEQDLDGLNRPGFAGGRLV